VKRLSDEIAVVHAHEAHWLGVSRRDHRAAAPLERAVIRRSSDAGGLAMRRRQLPIELLRRQLRDQERAGEADQRRRSTRAFAAQERGPSRTRMNEFAFHPEAEVDLIEIWDFIAEDGVDAADRVRDDISATVRRLVRTPNQGHRRNDLTSHPGVHDYQIASAPEEKPLLVLAVLHSRRNQRILAGILRGRE
jgi:plasmid stabilization system protein ParE